MTLDDFLSEWNDDAPTVRVKTSGSTGAPKPMDAEKCRMVASAKITCHFLRLNHGDSALLCLPLDYIAGKMMVVRALTWGLRLISVEPCAHPLASLAEVPDFAAVTPMQAWESMRVPDEKRLFSQIPNVIIGGGAVDKGLAEILRAMPNAVWSTYGMTETLSHVALRRLSGPDASDWYTPFEGVDVSLDGRGCLVISAPAVCAQTLTTNDIAEVTTSPDGSRKFRIVGRADNVICSGGIKIQAEQVERLLDGRISVPYVVTWQPDERLGQAVTLVLEGGDVDLARQACDELLPRYWRPKHIVSVNQIPRTETGKLKRNFLNH